MYFTKFLLTPLFIISIIVMMSCKSHGNYSDEPKKTNDEQKQDSSDSSVYISSTIKSEPSIKLSKLYVLFISHGTDSKKTEVVCKASCDRNTMSSSRDELNKVCKDAVFISRAEFDLDSNVKNLLNNKDGTLVDVQDIKNLESLYKRSDNMLKDPTVEDPLGKYSDVCVVSKANELYQVAQPEYRSSSSDWIAYIDSKTQATNQSSDDNRMWKDLTTLYFWTQPSLEIKTLEEAVKYCDNLNYGGLSDWGLPTKNDIPLSKWSSFNVSNSTVVGWWVNTKVYNENDDYYYLHATFSGYVFDKSSSQISRHVMCVNKTRT